MLFFDWLDKILCVLLIIRWKLILFLFVFCLLKNIFEVNIVIICLVFWFKLCKEIILRNLILLICFIIFIYFWKFLIWLLICFRSGFIWFDMIFWYSKFLINCNLYLSLNFLNIFNFFVRIIFLICLRLIVCICLDF